MTIRGCRKETGGSLGEKKDEREAEGEKMRG